MHAGLEMLSIMGDYLVVCGLREDMLFFHESFHEGRLAA